MQTSKKRQVRIKFFFHSEPYILMLRIKTESIIEITLVDVDIRTLIFIEP